MPDASLADIESVVVPLAGGGGAQSLWTDAVNFAELLVETVREATNDFRRAALWVDYAGA